MPLIPTFGIVNYNNIVFGPYTKTTAFSCEPVKDISGRTIAHNRYSISFLTEVNGSSCGVTVANMRRALTKNGGVFIYSGRATGEIRVNVGAVRDISFGPWVKNLTVKPLGSQHATIEWTIEFSIPECRDARFRGVPSEFSFTTSTQVDRFGYSTRTISLRARIPNNRTAPGSRTPDDAADSYLELLTPDLMDGFHRTFGPRELSEDKSEMRWTVVDTELDRSAPPPGIVEEKGSVSLSSEGAAGAAWTFDVSYSCETHKDGNLNVAWDAMESFVQGRVKELRKIKNDQGGETTVIPLSRRVVEPDALGRKRFEFSATYTVVTTLQKILANSGIWSQAPGRGDWTAWAKSLTATAFSPRGYAQLTFSPNEDKIVDLCGYQPPQTGRGNSPDARNNNGELRNKPKEKPTWLYYNCEAWFEQESGVVGTRTLPTSELKADTDRGGTMSIADSILRNVASVAGGGVGNNQPGGGQGGFNPIGKLPVGRIEPEYTPNGSNSATRVRRPQEWLVVQGEAIRVGLPVPEPTVKDYAGLKVLPANRPDRGEVFRQKPIHTTDGVIVYYATWRLRFSLDGDRPAGPAPLPPNPLFDGK